MGKDIQNPGSALGEAIGAQMEKALHIYLAELVSEFGCHYISTGPKNSKTGKDKKLLMYDEFENAYNIDAVVANESMQPLILVECKYIRYTKHNRDKGSWICTAHPAIRKKYKSIRSSIAVLAGSWSGTSIAMLKSHGTNVFLVPFEIICKLLSKHTIDFDWAEKDRKTAVASWDAYCILNPQEQYHIGEEMVNTIKADLSDIVKKVLDETTERELDKITLEFRTNIGETFIHDCNSIDEAIKLLSSFEFEKFFDTSDAPRVFDK